MFFLLLFFYYICVCSPNRSDFFSARGYPQGLVTVSGLSCTPVYGVIKHIKHGWKIPELHGNWTAGRMGISWGEKTMEIGTRTFSNKPYLMIPAGQGQNWSLWEIAGVLKSKTSAEANGLEIVGLNMIVKSHENPWWMIHLSAFFCDCEKDRSDWPRLFGPVVLGVGVV